METNTAKSFDAILKWAYINVGRDGLGTEIFTALEQMELNLKENLHSRELIANYHIQFRKVRQLLIDALILILDVLALRGEEQYTENLLQYIADARIAHNNHELGMVIRRSYDILSRLGINIGQEEDDG